MHNIYISATASQRGWSEESVDDMREKYQETTKLDIRQRRLNKYISGGGGKGGGGEEEEEDED